MAGGSWEAGPSSFSEGATRTSARIAPQSPRFLAIHTLPPDLRKQAARRLELASIALAGAYGGALVLTRALSLVDWSVTARPRLHTLICVTAVVASIVVARLARRSATRPDRIQGLALGYEVAVGFAISMTDNLSPLGSDHSLVAISWLCVWIVLFPLVVPASRTETLVAGILTASTWPAAYAIGIGMGNPAAPDRVVVLNFLENYIAVLLSLVPATILATLGRHVERAREMGSYELVERIDRGGMGEIWRARHRLLARPAAIKLIRADALGADGGRLASSLLRRFEREAQATASLHSPHTVELYDFGVTPEGTFYYVMEILEGLDLEAMVRRFGPVPPERAVHLLLHACDSLGDAHQAGLIHRDIKPSNLYACRKGQHHDFLKVLDFGLVKTSWAAPDDPVLTVENTVGTPAYMAPEVAMASEQVDGRVDIYGLGCVAYWLVTGQRLFEAENVVQMALHHVQTPPVPPSHRTSQPIPDDLEAAILACLSKDPAMRPATAEDLSGRLSATGLAALWSPERARAWWQGNVLSIRMADSPVPVAPPPPAAS